MSFITVMLNSSIKNGLLLESLLIQSAMLINQRKKMIPKGHLRKFSLYSITV